jgi:class 3 adenylate cyclase/tetratricopeptide (TPR) repeat protein
MVVGGTAGRWTSRLAGTAMAGVRAAIGQARPGEVAVGPHMAELLKGKPKLALSTAGGARLESIAPIDIRPALQPWAQARHVPALFDHVPAAVRDRIVAGQAGWLAEFRRVSVVFINVPEVDDDPARSLDRAQAVMQVIQTTLDRYGGTVDNLGDDHAGLTLVAAFGLPAWAHEDDALRAVRTALAVRAALRDLGYASAIGVTTGRLFCGAIGSARRRAYSMVGDTMNRCARLMGLAENDVLCDEETRRAAARSIRFEFLRHEELKGKASTVALHRPLGEAAAALPLRTHGIVGREAERTALRARLTALQEGSAGVVIIKGDAGIGKSTLLADFRAMAAEAGLRVLSGGGDSLERASAYHAWRPIFGDVLGFPPESDEAERGDRLLQYLSKTPASLWLAPLLNPALGLHLSENEMTAEIVGQPRAEATTGILLHLLEEAAAAAPLVVVLEDAHWADSASWTLALEVHRRVPRVLLTVATRPLEEPEPDAWAALDKAAGESCIALGPLAESEVLSLVRQRLGVDALPSAVTHFIQEKAEGHPFFSEELAYALRDAGHLVIENRRAKLAPDVRDLGKLDFPSNVKGVVRERIDRLSPREQMTIKVASVNGRIFSLRTLHAIHPVPDDREHLPSCLDRLVALDLAQRLEGEGGPAFIFKHNIIQEVAYEHLIFSHRQQLHRRLAEHLEHHDSANFPILAHHWRHADAPARAIRYLDLAGSQALRRYANREAIGFLEQAIELASTGNERPSPLDAGRWHRQIGEAHHHLGQIEHSHNWLSQAVRIVGHPLPPALRMKLHALPAALFRQVWNRLRRNSAAGGAARPEALSEAVQAHNQLGEIAFFKNDLVTSVFHIIHGLNLAEALGPSPKLAEMYAAMMIVAGALPPASLGDLYLRLSDRALENTESAVTRAYVGLLVGIFSNGRGRFEEAQRRLLSAAEVFLRYGHGRRLEESYCNIFFMRLYCGEYAAAREAVDNLRRSAGRREDAQRVGWACTLGAHLMLPTEGPEATLAVLGSGDFQRWDALTRNSFHAGTAMAHYRLGALELARQHAQAALDGLSAGPPVSYTAVLDCSYVAEIFVGLLDEAQRTQQSITNLARQARRACATMRAFSRAFPIGWPRAHLWTGLHYWVRGNKSAADRHWQNALTEAGQRGLPREQALAHALRALLHGEREKAHAAELLKRIGAHSELAWKPLNR